MARQICVGLHYAHSRQSADGTSMGIVHRDVSPSNLMLTFHGVVKILDFGIARVAADLRESRTQVGMMKGKISYMAPEQVRLGTVDHRADIFAVGIVLHETLTGQRLFKSRSEQAAGRMILEMAIPPPSVENPDVPPEIDRIVLRALERAPEARYQTAEEMANDLQAAIMELRLSQHESSKLLGELFPGEAAAGATPRLTQSAISAVAAMAAREEEAARVVTVTPTPRHSGPTRPGRPLELQQADQRRRTGWLVGGAVALAALVAVPIAVTRRKPAPPAPVAVAAAPVVAAPAAAPVPSLVHISLDSHPQDAEVTVVGAAAPIGKTPVTVDLPGGSALIELRFVKPGYEPATRKVVADLDKSLRVDLYPSPPAPVEPPAAPPSVGRGARHAVAQRSARPTPQVEAPAPAATCAMTIGSQPWAEVWIDGKGSGQQTPLVHFPVSCGKHSLRFKRADLAIDRAEEVTVTSDKELRRTFQLTDDDM
jgi:serine/threonine-protein kinase